MGKLFKLTSCHFPNKNTLVPWADIWVKFTRKPGRKTECLAPTFIGRADVESNLKYYRQLKRVDEEAVRELSGVLEALKTNPVVIVPTHNPSMPDIYTAAEMISREEAEQMISALLASLGFSNPRFRWARTKVWSIPS